MTAARSARTGLRLPDDPGRAGGRRAARAALIIPAAFAFARLVIGDAQATLFVAFGCFALLVMADFGGPRRPRALAYVATTLIGATLVTLGTLVSPSAWVAALLTLFVGFGVQGRAVAGLYRTVAAFLARSLNRVLERGAAEEAGRSRSLAVQARDRAGEALDQFLAERGRQAVGSRDRSVPGGLRDARHHDGRPDQRHR